MGLPAAAPVTRFPLVERGSLKDRKRGRAPPHLIHSGMIITNMDLLELIKTDRLKLRLFSIEDVEDVFSYASDPEWARFLPVPQPYTRADAEKFVTGQVSRNCKTGASWAVEYAGSVIGGIGMRFDFDNRVGEMGYSIARRLWEKGWPRKLRVRLSTRRFRPIRT